MALTVTSLIRTGANEGSQVVVVNQNLVAKIYDPLYYDPSNGSDVLASADGAYSREAAAYSHLQKVSEILDPIPTFYGTWTIKIKTPLIRNGSAAYRSRTVRLILIEYLQGICMADIDPLTLPNRTRSVTLKQYIDPELRILHTGLAHRDFVPRNIFLLGSDYKTPHIQVKVIDLNSSELLAHPRYADQDFAQGILRCFQKWSPTLTNPAKRYFGQLHNFACFDWCTEDHYEAKKWLWEIFGSDDQYVTVNGMWIIGRLCRDM